MVYAAGGAAHAIFAIRHCPVLQEVTRGAFADVVKA